MGTTVKTFFKRPSHVKLVLANSCWQTKIGMCERHNNMLARIETRSISRQQFANMLFCSHTPIGKRKSWQVYNSDLMGKGAHGGHFFLSF